MASYRAMQLCAERELRMRNRVYPKWVAERRMSEVQAKREIELMEDIAAHFMQLAETEGLPFMPQAAEGKA